MTNPEPSILKIANEYAEHTVKSLAHSQRMVLVSNEEELTRLISAGIETALEEYASQTAAAEIEAKTSKALGDLEGLSAKLENDILKSAEYDAFRLANPSESIKALYMKSAVTEKLKNNPLNGNT